MYISEGCLSKIGILESTWIPGNYIPLTAACGLYAAPVADAAEARGVGMRRVRMCTILHPRRIHLPVRGTPTHVSLPPYPPPPPLSTNPGERGRTSDERASSSSPSSPCPSSPARIPSLFSHPPVTSCGYHWQ
jgi:hypothetical protein